MPDDVNELLARMTEEEEALWFYTHRSALRSTPILAREDVVLLFEWHRYNGPLEGALEWNGKRYWFSADPEAEEYGQILRVMDLPSENWERVDQEQKLFEEMVGKHTLYDRETQRRDVHAAILPGYQRYYQREGYDPEWLPSGPVVAIFRTR